jgi:predicted nucleotidyltransferase
MLEELSQRSIEEKLGLHTEIAFAYLHGSSLYSAEPRDIDLAIFLFPEYIERQGPSVSYYLDFSIPLEQEIENVLHKSVDVQILNHSPLPFRFRVVSQNKVLLDRDFNMRERFELLSRVEYFDFRPRREEYLKEALA